MLPLTELGHSRQGQTKMGGMKWVSNPCVTVKDEAVCLSDMECSYPPRGTYTNCRGVALYPLKNQTRFDSQCMKMCFSKEMGVMHELQNPKLCLEIALKCIP